MREKPKKGRKRLGPVINAVTFNIEKHSWEQIGHVFERVLDDAPVDIWGVQEAKLGEGIDRNLQRLGYATAYNDPEFLLAVGPRFELIRDRDLVMSEEDYWLERNEALIGVARDTVTGRRLKLLVGHPPAHIAQRDDPTWENVYEVHKDYKTRVNTIGRRSTEVQDMDVITFEDANIDFVKDKPVVGDDWGWWFDGPFRPNRAPAGTHHSLDGRRIDYVRTTDGLMVGEGFVYGQKVSDHNPYRLKVWFKD